jgi:hypothetical protein
MLELPRSICNAKFSYISDKISTVQLGFEHISEAEGNVEGLNVNDLLISPSSGFIFTVWFTTFSKSTSFGGGLLLPGLMHWSFADASEVKYTVASLFPRSTALKSAVRLRLGFLAIVGLSEKCGFALTEDMLNVEIRATKTMKLNVIASFLEIILNLYALLSNKPNAIWFHFISFVWVGLKE